ncbi:hypothetical protein [Mycolicibacter minnesotensis]
MSSTSQCCDRPGETRPAGRRLGAVGVLAALACTLACCLPAILVALGVGVSAAAGAGHAAHGGGGSQGWLAALLEVLHRISPALLIASIVLVAAAFALRRRAAALPALMAGAVIYLSVHGQADPGVMYGGMALGYAVWVALYLWTRPRSGAGSSRGSGL